MKSKRKKQAALVFLAVLAVAVIVRLAFPWDRQSRVTRTVTRHQELLMQDIEKGNFTRSARLLTVRSVHPTPHLIEYRCGASGFGSATSYYGFYYAPDGTMDQLWCAGTPLIPQGNGWLYEEKNGDNRYYTEEITDGFYYYEASF